MNKTMNNINLVRDDIHDTNTVSNILRTDLLSNINYSSSFIDSLGNARFNQVSGTFVSNYINTLNGIPIDRKSTRLNSSH